MSTVLGIVGIVVTLGGLVAVFAPRVHNGPSNITTSDVSVNTTVTGVMLVVIGALMMFVGFASLPGFGADHQAKKPEPGALTAKSKSKSKSVEKESGTAPAPADSGESASGASGSASGASGASGGDATTGPENGSGVDAPVPEGPWQTTTDEMQLVVESIEMPATSQGRARVELRLTNLTEDDNITLDRTSFLAVDEAGHSYKMDVADSKWKADYELRSGERRVGSIVLSEKLRPGVESLVVGFNGAVGDWPDRFATVEVDVAVPKADVPAAPQEQPAAPVFKTTPRT